MRKTQFAGQFTLVKLAANNYYDCTPGECVPHADAGAAQIFFYNKTKAFIHLPFKALRRCVRTRSRSHPVCHPLEQLFASNRPHIKCPTIGVLSHKEEALFSSGIIKNVLLRNSKEWDYTLIMETAMDEDIRWKQRFQNYKKALVTVENAVELAASRELSDLEKQGLIKGFEFTFELAWNVMKDYLEDQGITGIISSKGAVRNAFNKGLIDDGQTWLDMIEARNISAHTYDEETADKLQKKIAKDFYGHFVSFLEKMKSLEYS